MGDAITDAESAFTPFYNDLVALTATRASRTVRCSFMACVFDQGLDDPIGDASVDSKRRRITVSIQRSGEGDIIEPQIGDTITLGDGSTFRVDAVSSPLGMTWEMEAREA